MIAPVLGLVCSFGEVHLIESIEDPMLDCEGEMVVLQRRIGLDWRSGIGYETPVSCHSGNPTYVIGDPVN